MFPEKESFRCFKCHPLPHIHCRPLWQREVIQFLPTPVSFLGGKFRKNKCGIFGISFLVHCKLVSGILLMRGGGVSSSHSPDPVESGLAWRIIFGITRGVFGGKMHSLGKKHWVMDDSQNSGTGALPLAQQSEIKMKIAKAKGEISFSLKKKKFEYACTKANGAKCAYQKVSLTYFPFH